MIDHQILAAIRSAQNFLCISHVSPDGDAIGSVLGIYWILRRLNKTPVIAMQDKTPEEHAILPGADRIHTPDSPNFANHVAQAHFDLIICLDASSPDRMGNVYVPNVHGQIPLLVIDHHVTNTHFGDFNWVDSTCAATCQMLVQLCDALGVPLDGELAECLLTGLVTDTLCFRTSNTNANVLDTAARLMSGGANLSLIAGRTVNRQPLSLLRLWGLILPTVQIDNRVIWAIAHREQFTATGQPDADVGLSSFLITVDEADISAVFTETQSANGKPAVECSFRAKPGFDVAKVAVALGGGGHPAASGCTISGTLTEIVPQVVSTLQNALSQQIGTIPGSNGECSASDNV